MIQTNADKPAKRPVPTKNSDYITRCYYLRKNLVAKIKRIAATEGLTITDTMDAMLSAAIDDYEAEHGEVKVQQTRAANPVNLFKQKVK